jgi:hypothetical protein
MCPYDPPDVPQRVRGDGQRHAVLTRRVFVTKSLVHAARVPSANYPELQAEYNLQWSWRP